MNRHAMKVLEFRAVVDGLRPWILSPLGEDRLARLRPTSSRRVAQARLARTKEAMSLLVAGHTPPLGPVVDPLPPVRRARSDALLTGQELAGVRGVVTEGMRVRHFLASHPQCQALHSLFRGIAPEGWARLEALEVELLRCVADDGSINDQASATLRGLRASLRALEAAQRELAQELVRDPRIREALQEPAIHRRAGRPVLPVKASSRDQVAGVLRDVSASGATLFVEPAELARLSAQREKLAKEQVREERRIRRALTRKVAAAAGEVLALRAALARMELAFAAAGWGVSRGGVVAELTEDLLELRRVRHPLLPDTSVPLSVRLDQGTRTLLVTGPNTGGKTVALKNVGLAVLITLSGLPVLGDEGTRVPVVADVLADIGDEQSIAQSLSTFSSHMSHIVEVMGRVRQEPGLCLVLLDELGAGTDPAEGEALGCAILEWIHLHGGSRVRVMASTHFARLKELASTTEGMANARMEFDTLTLRPTYQLSMGAPGASQALPVAQKCGLPPDVLQRAAEYLGPQRMELSRLLAAAEAERARWQHAAQEAEALARRLEEERASLARERERVLAELEHLKREFQKQAEDLLAWSRAQLKEARRSRDLRELQRRHVEVSGRLQALGTPAPSAGERTPLAVEPGQVVEVVGVGRGAVEEVDARAGTARVVVRERRVEVPLTMLRPSQAPPPHEVPTVVVSGEPVGPELMLVGLRAEEARERLLKYLEDATAADFREVRIIHGLGKGVLRDVVVAALRTHPSVVKLRPGLPHEGGFGVTVVQLR